MTFRKERMNKWKKEGKREGVKKKRRTEGRQAGRKKKEQEEQKEERKKKQEGEQKEGMGERRRKRGGDCLKDYRHGTTPAFSVSIITPGLSHTFMLLAWSHKHFNFLLFWSQISSLPPRCLALEKFLKPYYDLVCPQSWSWFPLLHKEKP